MNIALAFLISISCATWAGEDLSESALVGDYHTQTEHEWDVYVHLLPKGVLKIEYIVNDENVSEKKEIKGDWSLKNGELNLHFEKSSVRLILSSKKAKARGYLTPISWSGEQSYGLEGEPLYKGLKY